MKYILLRCYSGDWNNFSFNIQDNPSILNHETPSSSSSGSGGSSKTTNVYNTYVTNENDNSSTANSEDETNKASSTGITGGVIQDIFSKGNYIVIIGMFVGLTALYIISRTIIKLKKR